MTNKPSYLQVAKKHKALFKLPQVRNVLIKKDLQKARIGFPLLASYQIHKHTYTQLHANNTEQSLLEGYACLALLCDCSGLTFF